MNRLIRAARKLRKMPAAEVKGRIRQRWRQSAERRSYRKRNSIGASGTISREMAHAALVRAAQLVPGCQRSAIEAARRDGLPAFQQIQADALERAQSWTSGHFHLLGTGVDFSRPIDWHRDPRSGLRWPRVFYADMELYEPSGEVDVKHVWEHNRHQFLAEIARGWLCGGPARYGTLAVDTISGWIADNPKLEGVNWASGLEVAMRSLSWTWTLAALADWPDWHGEDLQRIVASLREHGDYLSGHLSFYSSPYNHLIGEATALFVLSLLLAGSDEASAWEELSRDVLTRHGPRQFYGDGFCVEQATGYHFFTLGFLAQALAAARHVGRPLENLDAVVHRAFRAGAALRQPDGRWPAVGDVDSARSLPVLTNDYWDFRGLCNLGAVLFADPALKIDGGGSELFWTTGMDGLRTWSHMHGRRQPQRYHLREAGYVVAAAPSSDGGTWLLVDGGPLGAGLHHDGTPSTAHGHADTLQVLYADNGRTILRDPGMPFYFGARTWVDHFRGPEAHNTIAVEGTCQGRHAGRLAWSHVMDRPELEANLSDDLWLVRATARWKPDVSVVRHVVALPERGLWILDWITSSVARRVEWFWQVEGDWRSVGDRAAPQSVSFANGIDHLHMSSSDGPLRATVEEAKQTSPIGWDAPEYGQLCPAVRLHIETTVRGELLVGTSLAGNRSHFRARVRGHTVGGPEPEGVFPTSVGHEDLYWHGTFPSESFTVVAGATARQSAGTWILKDSRELPAAMHVSQLRAVT